MTSNNICPACGALLWRYRDGRGTCSRCEYEQPLSTAVTPDQQLIHDLRKFQADEPGFPQIFSRAADTIEHLSWLAENKNAALKEAMAEVQRLSAAKTSEQGYTESEGYAASLRQQAEWINKARAGEMDSNDIDVDEILAAADFIDRSSAAAADIQAKLVKCESDRDEMDTGASHLVARIAELSAATARRDSELEQCEDISRKYWDQARAAKNALQEIETIIADHERTLRLPDVQAIKQIWNIALKALRDPVG